MDVLHEILLKRKRNIVHLDKAIEEIQFFKRMLCLVECYSALSGLWEEQDMNQHVSSNVTEMTKQQKAIKSIQFVFYSSLRSKYKAVKDQLMTCDEILFPAHIYTCLSRIEIANTIHW